VGYHSRREDDRERVIRSDQAVAPRLQAGEYTPFRITINGLCYKSQSPTEYLALAITTAHILITIGHSMYLFWRPKSSAAWDSTAEMLALAHNSHPSDQRSRTPQPGFGTAGHTGRFPLLAPVTLPKKLRMHFHHS
jgi:hypothetical protein